MTQGAADDKKEPMDADTLEQKEFLETVVNLSPDILYVYDIVLRKNVYSNNGVHRVLGYSAAEIKAMEDSLIATLMHPDDFAAYLKNTYPMYASLNDKTPIKYRYRLRHQNGEWRYLESSEVVFKRLPDGSPHYIVGVVHDISENQRHEDAIRESEEKFRIAFDNAPSGMSILAPDGRTLTVDNPHRN